ncbi:MAG: YIP1 family protein [Candidatus Nanohaloarchaea archaeon]
MELLDEWLETFESVLTGPSEYFRTEERRDGFGYSLKFAIVSVALAAVFNAARAGFFGPTQLGQALPFAGSAMVALGVLVLSPIMAIIGLLISAGLVHIFVALLGGDAGYSETLSVFEYATAISPITSLMSLVPVVGGLVNLVLGIYGLYIQVKGLENFQGLSTWRALGAIVLPGLVIAAVAVILVVAMGAAFASQAPGLIQSAQ